MTPDNLGLCRDTTLYGYALGADATLFIIPEELGVKCLAAGVFDVEGGTTSLQQIGLPSTLTHIRPNAFGSMSDVKLYFRGETPPKVDPGAFANTSAQTITLYVPAVIYGATVDVDATNARIGQFKKAMGMGNDYFIFQYYTNWPFDAYINGHEFVDLELPSGLKWATCNVGATKPEGSGFYFAWGETAPKEEYTWDTYFDTKDGGNTFKEYYVANKDGSHGADVTGKDDAAFVNWGGTWRMPTDLEWKELLDNCTTVWTKLNGVDGRLFTSNNNSATLFLPAAGYWQGTVLYSPGGQCLYWSSCLESSDVSQASFLYSTSWQIIRHCASRFGGFSVRPVSE